MHLKKEGAAAASRLVSPAPLIGLLLMAAALAVAPGAAATPAWCGTPTETYYAIADLATCAQKCVEGEEPIWVWPFHQLAYLDCWG